MPMNELLASCLTPSEPLAFATAKSGAMFTDLLPEIAVFSISRRLLVSIREAIPPPGPLAAELSTIVLLAIRARRVVLPKLRNKPPPPKVEPCEMFPENVDFWIRKLQKLPDMLKAPPLPA